MSESADSRFIKIVIASAGASLVLIIGIVVTVHFVSSSRRERQLAELTTFVAQAVQRSQQQAEEHEFDEARATLTRATEVVGKSTLSGASAERTRLDEHLAKLKTTERDYQREQLTALLDGATKEAQRYRGKYQFDRARSALQSAKADIDRSESADRSTFQAKVTEEIDRLTKAEKDYKDKLAKGYTHFEGKFLSPDEKNRVLAERKRQEEERLKAEQARREEAARAKAKAEQEEQARLSRSTKCPKCGGSGKAGICTACGGEGKVLAPCPGVPVHVSGTPMPGMPSGSYTIPCNNGLVEGPLGGLSRCMTCGGTGQVVRKCDRCGGRGGQSCSLCSGTGQVTVRTAEQYRGR